MKKIIATFLILFVTVFPIFGCSQNNRVKVIPVTGTITQNAKPVADARIEFSKINTGAMSFAETDAEGHCTLTHTHEKSGAESGKYRVSIVQKGKSIPYPCKQKTGRYSRRTPKPNNTGYFNHQFR
ncbi:MAG: carboxypeptidase-like regulatory domain-containing protein [Planctomycetaceae bacterium]|jgi:hypothetical protein|nr:carboxypeptidase-like regulatory domain-containing protein [Planctomycetaceae bacterium]